MIYDQMDMSEASDKLVCEWLQGFENINHRTSTFHHEDDNGDEFLTFYDPRTDRCLTVWFTKSRFGQQLFDQVKTIMKTKITPR